MLRLMYKDQDDPHASNLALSRAIDQVTLGRQGQSGCHIFHEHEAEAFARALASRSFTDDQLQVWLARLRADPPYDRQLIRVSSPSFFSIFKWLIGAGEAPRSLEVGESIREWRLRAERFVDTHIQSFDQPQWLVAPLKALDHACEQVTRETGRAEWAMPVLRWALVQLFIIPADTTSVHATG